MLFVTRCADLTVPSRVTTRAAAALLLTVIVGCQGLETHLEPLLHCQSIVWAKLCVPFALCSKVIRTE